MFRFTCLCTFSSFLISILISSTCASNILFFHVAASPSHRTGIWPLVEKLADSGHIITYVFPMSKRVGSHPGVEEIKPSKLIPEIDAYFGEIDINFRLNNTMEMWLAEVFLKMGEFCKAFYDSPETKEWLARPGLHYDLILIDASFGQCAYGLVHKFGAKHILFVPGALSSFTVSFGVVPKSSSIPEYIFHRDPATMATSLWSRVLSTISPFLMQALIVHLMRKYETIAKEKLGFDDTMPSFEEIEQETSLVLHNTYFIEDYPTALPPMFVSYSGLTCRRNETGKMGVLSKNLTVFIDDDSSDGFVYISFGSVVDMSVMPENLRNEFTNAFTAFPNLKFLWKSSGSNTSVTFPENVYVDKWFPQLDILAHPKIKAFVSQAGRSSTQEAICSGVPIVAMPIFGDQDYNAERLEYIGAAVVLDINSLTTEKLVGAIRKVTQDVTYKNRLMEMSAMFKDRPVDTLENAHFWVEYVLRHNTSLLKPLAMNQPWWQRRLLDVYLFLLLIVLTLAGALMVVATVVFKFIVLPLINRIKNNFQENIKNKEKDE